VKPRSFLAGIPRSSYLSAGVKRSPEAKLHDFVGEVEAAALSDRAELVEVIVAGIARLIRCDRVVSVGSGATTTSNDQEFQAFRLAHLDRWVALEPQHPKLARWSQTRGGAAVRLSDLLSRRALHRLSIYDYFWRPFGVEYDFGVRVKYARRSGIDLSCTRSDTDFSDGERDLLDAVRPYLARTLQRVDANPIAESLRVEFGISRREAELLALVARGQTNRQIAATLFLAPGTVRKHLEHLYAKLGVTTRTQAATRALETCIPATAEDLRLRRTLLHPDGITQDPSFNAYGLTSQEALILESLATGKGNAEIASELAISPQTVKKHLDHIYTKLQVRGRTEAAIRALRLDFPPRTSKSLAAE
jgi:DNA-binding NarL/FixJ family response regulator